MELIRLVACSERVGATRGRLRKQAILAELLGSLDPNEVATVTSWLTGAMTQGRIGVGPAALRTALETPAAEAATLQVSEVDAAFDAIDGVAGAGSAGRREAALAGLFGRATVAERRFLAQLMLGELRQGALEGLLVGALAVAGGADEAEVRRATMLAGSLADVADALLREGPGALPRFRLELGRPVQPMLAQTAEDVDEAMALLGEARFERKLDGARVQVHKRGDEVRVFTRHLLEVTERVPELVERVRGYRAEALVLDGEALVLRADGRPRPFQETMRRFGRRVDVAELRAKMPLSGFYFDVLRRDGDDLVTAPLADRLAALADVVPASDRVEGVVSRDPAEARAFFAATIAAGHEGVMAKALDAGYEAGARGRAWLKIKPVHTLDLVVLAVERGSGRRRGWLSNLHLGARADDGSGFVMLGKTFKGLTDAVLAWQTEALGALAVREEGHVVHVRPELVVEIAFNELQRSPRYPGGLALRFARVRRYRDDKRADEADTMATVWKIFGAQGARSGGGR